MHVGIVGGGILGITLGYFLSRENIHVTIFEAAPTLGGLAGPIELDGHRVDRFYHAVLSSDAHLAQLAEELDLSDQMRFHEAKSAFFHDGQIFPMTNMKEFLTFPPLSLIDRFRLGLTIAYAKVVRDWRKLETIRVTDWLKRLSGKRTFESIWRPMLRAKFDGNYDDTPATYIWSRLNRVSSTRKGADQREMAGHFIGGYITMLEAMAEKIREAGGTIKLGYPIQQIVARDGCLSGLKTADGLLDFDAVVCTMQTPLFLKLTSGLSNEYREQLGHSKFLGIVCPMMALDRPLTGYWTLNITDERIPFTGIIETTSYIDTQYTGGNHLVYLPKYTFADSDWFKMSDEDVRETWLSYLEKMFPEFKREWIRHFIVQRARLVEPLHPVNCTDQIPAIQTPVRGLYLANTEQIYPALTNGESVTAHARQATEAILQNRIVETEELISRGKLAAWQAARRIPAAPVTQGSSQS